MAACVAAAVVFLTWEIAHRGTFQYATSIYPIDPADEWRYTACGRLVEHGYALFSQVFSAQPPLLFVSLSWGMRLFGDSISGARWVEIGFGLLGLGSAAWIAWLIAGPVAGAATALLLAISPSYLVYSHTVEAEGPMMALITLSLALVLVYVRLRAASPQQGAQELSRWGISRRRSNQPTPGTTTLGIAVMLVAGLALAGGILMKLFAAVALLPVLWILLADRQNRRQSVLGGLAYGAGAAIPVGLDFALLHPRQQWSQVVTLHQRAANLHLPGMTPPLKLLGQFLAVDLGLTVLAASGLLVLFILGRWYEAGFFGSWIVGTLLMLVLFRPLFAHHPAIVLTGLGACAGSGIGMGVESLATRWSVLMARGGHPQGAAPTAGRGGHPQGAAPTAGRGGHPQGAAPTAGSRIWAPTRRVPGPGTGARSYRGRLFTSYSEMAIAAIVAACLVAYVGLVPRLAHADRHLLSAAPRSAAGNLAAYVRGHSSPRDLVAADDLEVADRANRLVPPPLCDPSTVRLRAGYLTAQDLVGATTRYRPKLVVPSFGIFRQVGGYMSWLEGHYSAETGPDGQIVFVRR